MSVAAPPGTGHPQDLYRVGVNQPHLCTEEQHQLNERLKNPGHPQPHPLPAKDLYHPPSHRPPHRQIPEHLKPIVVRH